MKKKFEDNRGKILFLLYGDKKVNLVETRKGFARGGHFHKTNTSHFLIKGKMELREENIKSKEEKISIIQAPFILDMKNNLYINVINQKSIPFFALIPF